MKEMKAGDRGRRKENGQQGERQQEEMEGGGHGEQRSRRTDKETEQRIDMSLFN